MTDSPSSDSAVERLHAARDAILSQLARVIVGQEEVI